MLNTKTSYIHALSITKEVLNDVNRTGNPKGVTFLTSYGQVQGEIAEIKSIDVSSGEALHKTIESLRSNGEQLDIFSLTQSLYDKTRRRVQEDYDVKYEGSTNEVIALLNVKIRTHNGEISELEGLVLFTDQIIGVIPGAIL